jgi:hypothetical protein
MASAHTHDPRVDLLCPVQVWHAHWTASMGQPVFAQTRTTARARQWPLAALAAFWTAVLLRAPQSLPHAWEAAATRPGAGWPAVPARPEAGCERCQSLPWRVCAPRDAAVVDPGWPDARPCAAPPVQALRQHLPDGWVVEGSRLDAVAHRRKLRRAGRAGILPGGRTAFSALSRGSAHPLGCAADAAAGARPRPIAALPHGP